MDNYYIYSEIMETHIFSDAFLFINLLTIVQEINF